jgi:hypothetical protein
MSVLAATRTERPATPQWVVVIGVWCGVAGAAERTPNYGAISPNWSWSGQLRRYWGAIWLSSWAFAPADVAAVTSAPGLSSSSSPKYSINTSFLHRRNGGRAGGHAYRRAMGRGRRPDVMRGAAGSRDVPVVSSLHSMKLAAPMVALSDAAAITDDQAIAARFFVASSSVTADHNGRRIRVLGRRDGGWRFGDLIGGSSVKAPLFGSDLGGVVRVVLAGHEVARSDEGFALETSDGGLVLRPLDGSPVACLRQGRWESDSLRGVELTIEAGRPTQRERD